MDAWEGAGATRVLEIGAGWVPFTAVWNVTGQPALALPVGRDAEGLPLAVQLVGRPHDEATLVALAAQLERAGPPLPPPRL